VGKITVKKAKWLSLSRLARRTNNKTNKMKTIETSKESIKANYLDKIANIVKEDWHSQGVHKRAVMAYILDLLEIKDQTSRDAAMEHWVKTPGGFGTNSSGLGQQLGRPKGESKAKLAEAFKGF
jgi:hypothetical protein